MENTFVYLIGPPGVGKYTVGKELADRMPARLIDNHYWNNPVFALVEYDGVRPLPAGIWERAAAVRAAVLETIATLAPADRNFVFTHAVTSEGGHPLDMVIAGQILRTAERRGARTLVARLSCAAEQLARRIADPVRAERLKQLDASRAAAYAALPPFEPRHPWTIDIDTTDRSPAETAARILEALA